MLAFGDESTVARMLAAFPKAHVVTITERTLGSLRAGLAITVPLAELGVHNLGIALVFAGETEYEVIAQLRAAGLIGSDTTIDGIEEYDRHERNEVADCPRCLHRHHGLAAPLLAVARDRSGGNVPQAGAWRERLYRHPYLFLIACVALISAATLLAERC